MSVFPVFKIVKDYCLTSDPGKYLVIIFDDYNAARMWVNEQPEVGDSYYEIRMEELVGTDTSNWKEGMEF
jgi:hypothetical protein